MTETVFGALYCPFCKNEEIISSWIRDGIAVGCGECGVMVKKFYPEAEAKAIEAWNRRAGWQGVKVKGLEWRKPDAEDIQDRDDCLWMAIGVGGRYAISLRQLVRITSPDNMGYLLWDADDAFAFTEHLTVEAAKAAAQADYEHRILSALVPAEAGVEGDAVERGRQIYRNRLGKKLDEFKRTHPSSVEEDAKPVQVGWAYQDKKWDADRWHVCGWEKPREFEGRKVEPVYILAALTHPSLLEECKEVLAVFIAKLDGIHDDPDYKRVWEIAQLHSAPYSGPNYINELAALRALLTKLEAGR